MLKNDFGKKIKELRKERKLTQAKLAELAGVNEKHISKIETGVYFPTFSTLNKILKVLKVNIEAFELGIKNPIVPDNIYYLKSLQILNSAKTEKEIEYYYGFLNYAQQGIKILNGSSSNSV